MDPVLKIRENCIFVVGGVITRGTPQNSEILAFRRHHHDTSGGKWEFPGGKIEDNETPEAAIRRELSEELGVEIEILCNLRPMLGEDLAQHRYATVTIDLTLFWVQPKSWNFRLPEHQGLVWVDPERASALDWLAADRPTLAPIFKFLSDPPGKGR